MANLVLAGEQVAPTSIESALSHYLKVDVLREQRVEPAARALEAAIAKHGFPDAAPTDLFELRYDDGLRSLYLWHAVPRRPARSNAKAGAHEAPGNWTRDTSGTRLHQLRASAAWKRSWWQTGRLMIAQQRSRILPLSRSKRRAAGWASALEAIIKKLGS
jgi:hypothetical protein